MIPTWLAQYYKTKYRARRFLRIFCVSSGWRILDIGSGDSPFTPADVICEKFPWDDSERVTGFIHDRPLVVGDGEDLPFRDQSFDFIHCCHVLEHVYHPDRVIQELMRVGKRGYIETPATYYEKALRSTAGHLWFVRRENGVLIFTPKARGILDAELNDIFDNRLLDKDPLFSIFCYGRMNDLGVVSFFWESKIDYRLEGHVEATEKTKDLFEKASSELSPDKRKPTRRLNVLRLAKKAIRWWFSKGKQIDLDQLLACPICKGNLLPKKEIYHCARCQVSYPMRSGIPVLLKEAASPFR